MITEVVPLNIRIKMLHLRLRTLLIFVALTACFLAWRCSDPERTVVAALTDAGGEVYWRYQSPQIGPPMFVNQMILPDKINFEQCQIKCERTVSPRSVMEFLFGCRSQRRVSALKLPVSAATPSLMKQISALSYLETIYIEMPATCASKGSPEAKRLEQIRLEFGDRVYPTLHEG